MLRYALWLIDLANNDYSSLASWVYFRILSVDQYQPMQKWLTNSIAVLKL